MAAASLLRNGTLQPETVSWYSSSRCNRGSSTKVIVRALAFAAYVQHCAAFASLRGRAAPELRPGLNPRVWARRALLQPVQACSARACSSRVSLTARAKSQRELPGAEDEADDRANACRKISEAVASSLERMLMRVPETEPRLEKQLRDFLFTKARVFTLAGDLTTLYGFIPVLAQFLVLSDEFNCMELTDPTQAVPAGLALLSRTVQLQFFSVVLLGVSLSQLVVSTRESLSAQDLLLGRDPFCLDLWFPIGFNARPGGARITYRSKAEPGSKAVGAENIFQVLSLAVKSKEERRGLEFVFTFQDEAAVLKEETADILVFGTMLPLIAIIGAVAPYLAYIFVGVRDAQLGGTDPAELAQLNVRLATSQVAIALVGVTLFVSAIFQASPELRSEFSDKKKAGVLAAETVKLVDDAKGSEIMAKTILPTVLAAVLLLGFSIDGFRQEATMDVTKKVCLAVKSAGRQVKLQTNFGFDATAAARNLSPSINS